MSARNDRLRIIEELLYASLRIKDMSVDAKKIVPSIAMLIYELFQEEDRTTHATGLVQIDLKKMPVCPAKAKKVIKTIKRKKRVPKWLQKVEKIQNHSVDKGLTKAGSPRQRRKNFTRSERSAIFHSAQSGVSSRTLAEKYGSTEATIYGLCQRLKKTPEFYSGNGSEEDRERALAPSQKRRGAAISRNKKFTMEQRSAMLQAREAGISNKMIAEKYKTSPNTIASICYNMRKNPLRYKEARDEVQEARDIVKF